MSKMRLSKRKLQFFLFYVGETETEKKKMEKAKKPYQNSVSKVVIQKCEKSKKWIVQKLPDTICVRKGRKNAHFRAHCLFWPKNLFWPKTV